MLHDSNRPSYVFFMTDGQPTVGERSEVKIAAGAAQANTVHARMFAFGVGYDVNGRLLDRLARELRGQSVYVRPNENIEAPVSALYAKVGSPVMTGVAIDIQLDGGSVSRVYPRQLPDLFRGDQLVLVGRYKKGGAARIRLTGNAGNKQQSLTYQDAFNDVVHDESNAFVARLWALRRIGEIIDDLDLHGRNQELVDELVTLSKHYGIMTPYTSFLTDDNVNLSDLRSNVTVAAQAVNVKLNVVDGLSGFAQREQKAAFQNATNLQSAQAIAAEPSQQAVQNIGRKAFFKKNRIWQDSTVTSEQARNAIHVAQFSREYFDLMSADKGRAAQYLTLNEPVLVNIGARTYQIDPAP
jgi:Ca-activated chloride channel family protein